MKNHYTKFAQNSITLRILFWKPTSTSKFYVLCIKFTVVWNLILYTFVDRYWRSGRTCCVHLQERRWRQQHVPPICWYLYTKLHSVTSQ